MKFKPYPKYKASGVEWFGEIPTGWSTKALKHCVEIRITDGPHETPVFVDDGVLFISAEAIKNSKIDFERRRGFITEETFKEYSKKCVPRRNDIFMVKSGNTTGNFAMVETDETFTIWSPLALIRPDVTKLSARFVFYNMAAAFFQENVRISCSYGTQPNIGMGVIENLFISVPPLSDQIAIATFLDHETGKIDTLITKQEKLIDLLKEKRQAVISHAVTKGLDPTVPMKPSGVEWLGDVPEEWKVISIKWISPVSRGASPRPIDDPKYFDPDGEYAWVRIADVSASDGLLLETTQRLSALGSSLSVKIEPGELFISIAGTVGKPCISGIKACIHDGFVYFPLLAIDPKFLFRIFEAGTCYGGLGKWGTQLNLNTDRCPIVFILWDAIVHKIRR